MKIKKWIKRLSAYIPVRMPIGKSEFEKFVADIAELSGLPDNAKLRQTIAQFIFQTPINMVYCSRIKLANVIKKLAVIQTAHELTKQNDEKAEQTTLTEMGQEASRDRLHGH